MRSLALALLVLAAPLRADEPAPKPVSLRAELAVAIEEYHAAERRLHRGGPDGEERHELKHQMRDARRRVKALKRIIFKAERRADDYFQDDPYPQHKADPETGGKYKP